MSAQAGVQLTGLGNASSWIDADGDGALDLFATNSDFPGRVWLYRNLGDGTFEDVTSTSGLGGVMLRSVAWGDMDDDGLPDLAGTTYDLRGRTRLYHNLGGTFVEEGALRGMVTAGSPWRVSWADYDRDGWLDLYQADLGPDLLYRNLGDGVFEEVAASAGVSGAESSQAAAWADEDGDGWPDLYVADSGGDHLYRNRGDGTFEDVTETAGVSDPSDSVSACWGDYDADGRFDLYVVNIGAADAGIRNRLYRNAGDGTFTEVAQAAGVGDVGDGRSCSWLDVDQDGRLDLYASDHVHASRLYRNRGDGTFTDIAPAAGLDRPLDAFNAAWGDFDADGDLDAAIVGHIGNGLFANQGPTGAGVSLSLVGTSSNASAIGARATLWLGRRPLLRQVEGSGGAYGQDSLPVEFGVGSAPGPFRVQIQWPSGVRQTVRVAAGASAVVVEPAGPTRRIRSD